LAFSSTSRANCLNDDDHVVGLTSGLDVPVEGGQPFVQDRHQLIMVVSSAGARVETALGPGVPLPEMR